ncbi:MAG: ABC transporter ATP-binding protein [Planctomycetia bacterium]|nr:ABC transporter ATP-binding protein [Planctomycetia bacterium]
MIGVSPVATKPDIVPLWCKKVSKWHGNFLGLNDVSLELRPGITALLGSNGSGKSTLMNLIAGQLYPDTGSIRIFGVDPWTWRGKHLVGYSPDLDYFYSSWSINDFLMRMACLAGIESKKVPSLVNEILDVVGLLSVRTTLLRRCSLGMRQRAKIAHAILMDPPLLVLDEPFRGIDPVGRRDLVQLLLKLQSSGKTILVSSHELEEIEKLTSQVVMLRSGRVVSAGPVSRARDRLLNKPVEIALEIESAEQIRFLAQTVFNYSEVLGVHLPEGKAHILMVLTRNPEIVFSYLVKISIENNIPIRRLEVLDEAPAEVMESLFQG